MRQAPPVCRHIVVGKQLAEVVGGEDVPVTMAAPHNTNVGGESKPVQVAATPTVVEEVRETPPAEVLVPDAGSTETVSDPAVVTESCSRESTEDTVPDDVGLPNSREAEGRVNGRQLDCLVAGSDSLVLSRNDALKDIPPVEPGGGRGELGKETKCDSTLGAWRALADQGEKGFLWKGDLLFVTVEDTLGQPCEVLVIPNQFRKSLLKAAHEGA